MFWNWIRRKVYEIQDGIEAIDAGEPRAPPLTLPASLAARLTLALPEYLILFAVIGSGVLLAPNVCLTLRGRRQRRPVATVVSPVASPVASPVPPAPRLSQQLTRRLTP